MRDAHVFLSGHGEPRTKTRSMSGPEARQGLPTPKNARPTFLFYAKDLAFGSQTTGRPPLAALTRRSLED